MSNFEEFFDSYLYCALWATDDNDGEPLTKAYRIDDISYDSYKIMLQECEAFWSTNSKHINEFHYRLRNGRRGDGAIAQLAGHVFWLTRNGHSAGFGDGDWKEPQASILTAAAKDFGECELYVGDDGKLHISSEATFWLDSDNDEIAREGWKLAKVGTYSGGTVWAIVLAPHELMPLGHERTTAMRYVRYRALFGSERHQRALRFLQRHDKNEYDRVMAQTLEDVF